MPIVVCMNVKHSDTRTHILAQGRAVMAQKGFNAVGLTELLKLANVPKGSFYHYFESKEKFGHALIQDYVATYMDDLESRLDDAGGTAANQLLTYFRCWQQSQTDDCTSNKCLVVKLSAEIADFSVEMREALQQGTDRVIARLASLIETGTNDGSIHADVPPRELAEWLYQLWLGASLLDKLRKNGAAFDDAMRLTERLIDATKT